MGSPGVQCHGRVVGVLGEVKIGGATELLLNHERLLQKLETTSQKLVLDLQKVTLGRKRKSEMLMNYNPLA